MLKLFDLNKAMVGISKNERSVLLTLIEVMDEGWVFTISVVVVGAEEVKRGREMSELTREVFATHSGTGGRKQVERDRSTTYGSSCVGPTSRKKKGGEMQKTKAFPMGTLGKRGQVAGNSWFQPDSSSILNSNKLSIGPDGSEKADEAWAGGDKAHSNKKGHRASFSKLKRMTHSLPNPSPLVDAKLGWERGCNLKGLFSKLD